MGRNRKRYEESFKRKVALEAYKGEKSGVEIAAEYNVSPSMVTEWKQRLESGADSKELEKAKKALEKAEKEKKLLAEQLGLSQMEIELLKKKTRRS